jgi:AraC-like DNA-binding protein
MAARSQLDVEALHFGYNATEHIVQPEATRMGFVQRDEVALHLLVAGGIRVHFATGDVHELRPQAIMVSWGGPPHRAEWLERDTHLFGVTVPLPWVLGWPLAATFRRRLLEGKPLSIPAPGDTEIAAFRRWAHDLGSRDAESADIALLEIQARLRRFARDWEAQAGASQAPNVKGRVAAMLRYLHEHRAEAVQLGEVARHFGYSAPRFTQVFQRATGETPSSFLAHCRVAQAQALLLTTDWPMARIAESSGFGSVSQFHAVFRRQCGQTPSGYRATGRRT